MSRICFKNARRRAFKAQGGRCFYCTRPMWLHGVDSKKAFARHHGVPPDRVHLWQCTGDHAEPKSKGGGSVRENIVAACLECNMAKGDRAPHEWTPPAPMWRMEMAL